MDLVIATKNRHKYREIKGLLRPFTHFDLYSLNDFPSYIPPLEEEESFEKNAQKKAIHAAVNLQKWVIGDDSGLVVPALHGAPGVLSARYAGLQSSDIDNRKKLLKELQGIDESHRSAYFECALVLASPKGLVKSVKGICEGMILSQERGRNGFGYDSLFLKYDYNQTFAELDEQVKNLISHRAKAFEKLKIALFQLDSLD